MPRKFSMGPPKKRSRTEESTEELSASKTLSEAVLDLSITPPTPTPTEGHAAVFPTPTAKPVLSPDLSSDSGAGPSTCDPTSQQPSTSSSSFTPLVARMTPAHTNTGGPSGSLQTEVIDLSLHQSPNENRTTTVAPKKKKRVDGDLTTKDTQSSLKSPMKKQSGKKVLQRKNQETKTVQQEEKQCSKPIKSFKELIKELESKNLVTGNAASHLIESLPDDETMDQVMSDKSKGEYPQELRNFAVILKCYSTKAYNYVRSNFKTALPSVKTVQKWNQKADSQPGFRKEAVKVQEESAEAKELEMELKEHVKKTLGPRFSDDECNKIMQLLKNNGIHYVTDLREEILQKEVLYRDIPIVIVNKLYLFSQTEPVNKKIYFPALKSLDTQLKIFEPNFKEIGLKSYLESDSPLKSEIRNAFIHHIISQLLAYHGPGNPGINYFRQLAMAIAELYPNHFYDSVDKTAPKTAHVFAQQLCGHCYYKSIGSSRKKMKSAETVGTVEFMTPIPQGQTKDTLEEIRVALEQRYKTPEHGWDIEHIAEQMNVAYALLRESLAKKVNFKSVISKWPFLKIYQIFILHYNRLMNKNVEKCIEEFYNTKLDLYIRFFKSHSSKTQVCDMIEWEMICASGNKAPSKELKLLAIVHMIAIYMSDDFSAMIRLKKQTTSNEELEALKDLPEAGNPIIVALGPNVWRSRVFCVMIENSVVARFPSFEKAFVYYFASFFVGNLQYPTPLNSTLDFIQRVVMQVVPEPGKGTKCCKKGKGKCPDLRIQVEGLLTKVTNYEKQCEEIKAKFQ